MKVIRDLVKVTKDELKDAERSLKMAMEYKSIDNATAIVFATIARQKIDNATGILHARQVALIKEHKSAGKEVPPAMQTIWDWEHEQIMEDVAYMESLMAQYKK